MLDFFYVLVTYCLSNSTLTLSPQTALVKDCKLFSWGSSCKEQLFKAFVCSVDCIKKRPVLFIFKDGSQCPLTDVCPHACDRRIKGVFTATTVSASFVN